MNLNNVLFFTACDANYFEVCMDLIKSLRHARTEIPRMRIFDVGLHPQQSEILRKHVEVIIEPGWDLGQHESYPQWFRAMTSRPFLPKYASNSEIIVWLDADTWVQSWHPLNDLVCAASSGELAIAEEPFGAGLEWTLMTPNGAYDIRSSPDQSRAYARRYYEQCFGPEVAAAYGDLPMFNSGVFALRADSPTWAVWRDILSDGLRGGFNKLVEQQALCIAIRQGAHASSTAIAKGKLRLRARITVV
jgi:hypothetical protein